MAGEKPFESMTDEEKAASLKAKEKPLGKSESAEDKEESPIAWETGSKGDADDVLGNQREADSVGTTRSSPSHLHTSDTSQIAPEQSVGIEAPASRTSHTTTSAAQLGTPSAETADRVEGVNAKTAEGSTSVGGTNAPTVQGQGSDLHPGQYSDAAFVTPISKGAGSGNLTDQAVVTPVVSTGGVSYPDMKISGDLQSTVTEDKQVKTSGQLTVSGGAPGTKHWLLDNRDGQYGSLELDSQGHWQYTLNNSSREVQALIQGQEVDDSFTAYIVDADGKTQVVQLVIAVRGTNDAASVSGVDAGVATEDLTPEIMGVLKVHDTDTGENYVTAQTDAPGSQRLGYFSVNKDGHWTYRVDNSLTAVQELGKGQSVTDSLVVTTADGTQHIITVTIEGSNDGPVIQQASATIHEDAQRLTGQIQATDIDKNDHLIYTTRAHIDGFVLTSDGAYTFDSSHSAYQHLAAGQSVMLSIPVTVTDSQGGQDTQNLQVTIIGTNDGPVFQTQPIVQVDEGAGIVYGQLSATEIDVGDKLTYSSSTPVLGFSLNADGSYSFDSNHAEYNSLAASKTLILTIPVTVTDSQGATDSQNIQITITGTNDGPQMQLIPSRSVDEGAGIIRGQLSSTDVDTGDTLTYSSSLPVHGFSLNADGSYSFDANHAEYNSLAAGQTRILTIPVTVTDSQGATDSQNIQITITGTNDGPQMQLIPTQRVNEDASVVSGQLGSSDPDSGDIAIYSSHVFTPGFILHADGGYTFDPSNPAYQHLADGQVQDIKIPVSVMDSKGGVDTREIVIQVVGTNDLPKLLAQPGFSLHEDDAVVKGQFTALDIDTTDTLTFSTPNPVHGFTLNPDGSYSFDPSDTAYQHLAPGDHIDLQIPVIVSDGHGGTATRVLQITVNGTDDVPVIAAMPKQTVVEDQLISGQMTATDADDADKLTFSLPAPVDGLTLNPDGSYTFDAGHPSFQHLAAGDKLDLSIPVSVADSHGQASMAILHIAVTGTNDVPMVVGLNHAMGSVGAAQGGVVHVDGQLSILDVDTGESSFQPQLLQGTYGVLAIDASGKWTYTADAHQSALKSLQGQQFLPEHFQIITADGTTHDIDLAIKGQNTPAVFGGVSTGMTKEDLVGSASGKMVVTDPNVGEAKFIPLDQGTPHGHFTLTAEGHWTFTLNNQNPDVQALAESGMISERITVGSIDGTPHVVIVNIVGTNDQPMIGGTATGAVKEDDTADTISGTLIDGDVDTGAQQTWSVVGNSQGSYGSLAIDPKTGQWTYTIDNSLDATQQLAEGHPGTESFTVRVTDEHGATAMKTVVITVNATNDAPVVSSAVTLPAGTEDTTVTLTTAQLLAHSTDVDAGETAQLSVHNLQADHGTITDNGDGSFTFTPDKDYNGAVSFSYDVQDAHGASAPATATMDLAAVQDAAVIGGQKVGDITENAHALHTLQGILTIHDPDSGEERFVSVTKISDPYNSNHNGLIISSTGSWVYTARDLLLQHLAEGESKDVIYEVTTADGTTERITITVHGTNDAPTLTFQGYGNLDGPSNPISTDEDKAVVIPYDRMMYFVEDKDTLDTLHVENLQADHGTIHDNGDGTFTFTPEKDFNGRVTFTCDVADNHGASVHTGMTMPVNAINDAAIIIGTGKVTPDDDTAISGQLTVTDVDAGEDHFKAQTDVDGLYGKFSITADGQWTYTPDSRADALAVGQAPQETFTVHSADGTSHDVVITVTGSSDIALGGDKTGSALEDGATTISGDLTLTDEVGTATTPHFGDHVFKGSYGTLDLRDQGHWIYNLNNQAANVQGLKEGQVVEERFHLTMPDGTTRDVVIQVTGTHDQPQIQAVDTKPPADLSAVVQVTEFTGATDLDMFQTVTQGVPVGHKLVALYMPGDDQNKLDGIAQGDLPSIHTAYKQAAGSGYVYLDTNGYFGQHVPDVDSGAVAPSVRNNWDGGLAVFDDGTVVRVVKVCDGNSASEHDYIYFEKIEGVNANTGVSLISGSAAAGETVEIYEGSNPLGTATADSNGHWQIGVTKLADGDHDIHTVVNGVSSEPKTVAVSGDQAVLHEATPLIGSATEDSSSEQIASGQMHVTDADTNDHPVFTQQQGTHGTYGTFSIDADGNWQYALDNSLSTTQQLVSGHVAHEIFTVEVTTDSGEAVTQMVQVNVTGTNDAPTVSADTTAHAADLGSSDLGQPVHYRESDLLSLIGAADVDTSDTLSVSAVAIDASVGSFAKDAVSGEWVFTPVGGASATDAQVQITITDGTTSTTAQAKLDVVPPPPLAISTITSDTGRSSTDFITSDNSLVISGTGTPGDTVRVMDGPFTSLGTAVVDATGQWSIDHTGSTLRDGTHHIMVLGKNPDGSAGTIEQPLVIDTGMPTITIEPVGQDDVLDSSDQGKPLTISGAVTHVDDGNTVTIDIAGKTYTGIVQAGTWSVTVPTADADALQDQNLLIHAHVETTAGTPAEADHHLIVSASPDTLRASGQLQEDVTVTDGGQVFRLNGDGTVDTPTSMDGNFGTLIVDASGQYHYQLNNNAPDIQALGQGESVSDHFLIPITLADGSHRMAQVDFDIAGTNDAPTITGGLSAERSVHTTATTHMSTTGQVVINDVDTHDTLSLTINGQQVDLSAGTAKIDTAVGQLAIRPDGNWEYMLDKGGPERDQLNSLLNTGGSQQERFHMVVTDSHGESRVADIVVTIAGDAGNPTLRGTLRAAVVEDATLEADGVLNVVDANGVKQTGVTGWTIDASHSGTFGAFSIDAQGHWHYTLNNANPAVQALAGGEQLTDHATITATDANGQPISRVIDVDIIGTNDAPVISGDHIGNTAEDATASISGKLLASDIDSTDSVAFTAETLAGGFGSLNIDADGHWTYQVDNTLLATQGLNAGQTEPETFEVTATSTDGTSIKRIITINITGREDAPVIAGSHTGTVTEDATTTTVSGDLTATDADLGDTAVLQASTQQGTYGTFSMDASGHWTYTLNNSLPATQALSAGQSQPESFTVTATTADGETVTKDITVTVTGTNDAPTLTATDTAHAADLGATDEDTAKTFTESELLQLVGATDADGSDTLHVTAVTSPHGTFTQDATSGDWTFNPAANYHGDDVQVSLTINDGHTDVTAHGTIDVASVTDAPAPDLAITAEQQVMEFAAGSASGVVNTGTVNAGGTMHGITIDMTILGGDQVSSSGGHGATLISYGTSSDYNHMYIWNDAPGKDLTFRVGGQEYATGVEMRNDGHDHRYTFSWDGNAGTLDVLVDGQVVKQMTGVGQGATIEDGGKFALGNDQDSFGGGFSANDAFTGKIFNVGIAKTAVDTAQLQTAQVGSLLKGDSDLLTVIHVQNGHFVDQTGNYQYHTVGSVHVTTVEVDTSIAPPNPGALLSIQLSAGAPADTEDQVTAQSLVGLPAGTVISDGHGHSITITDPTHPVEVQGWTLSSLTAQLPASFTDNILVEASVTTTGPDGQVESANSYAGVVLDPTKPLPQANASGDTDPLASDVSLTLSLDPNAQATSINIDPITQDNILEHSEAKGVVTVTGTVSGNFENDDTVTISVHNISFTGQVDASGVFAVEVPAAALAAANELEASISPAQGGGTFSQTHRYGVDIREAGGITVELVDDTGNPTDHLTSNGALNFIGEEVGGRLEFSTDGGQTWGPTFTPQEGHNQFLVRQIDAHGNVSGATDFAFTLDTQVGNLAVNLPDAGSDNQYSPDELSANGTLTAEIQLPSDAVAGDTLTIDGADYTLTSQDIANGVVEHDVTPGQQLAVSFTDQAGNTSTVATSSVSQFASSVSIESVDNSLEVTVDTRGGHQIHGQNHPGQSDKWQTNAFETTSGDVTIYGSAVGVADGSPITVHLEDRLNPQNSFDLQGTVSGGQWSVTIDHTRVDQVGDHDWQVNASTADLFGTALHATTEIIDTEGLSQTLSENGAAGSLDLLDGADQINVAQVLYSTDGTHFSSQLPAGVSLDADGHTLHVDPNSPAFDHLAPGDEQKVYVRYQLTETVGGTPEQVDQTAVITVTGTDDLVRISGTTSSQLDTATSQSAQGTLAVIDPDSAIPPTDFVVQSNTAGTYGSFSVDINGDWTYTLDPDNPATRALAAGEQQTDTFTVTTSDGLSHDVVVTVTGADDLPEITGTTSAVADDTTGQAQGSLAVTDPDDPQFVSTTTFVAQTGVQGQYGSFEVNEQGQWHYTLDPTLDATRALKDGEQQPDTFTVTTADGHSHEITVTVTGTNDAPTVTAHADLGTTGEDTSKTFTEADLLRLVGANDPDAGDTLHVSSVSIDPSVGSFTHDSVTGAWTFTPAANFDGSHLPVSIEISDGTDTTTAHAAINVTPVADTPTLDISLGSIALSADVPLATQVGVSAGPNFEGSVFVDFGGMYGTPVLFGDPAELAHVQGILAGGTMISLGAAVHDPVHGDGVQLPGAEACRAFVDNDGSGSVKMIFDSDAPAQMHFAVYYSGVEDWIGDFANWGDFSIDRTPASGGPSHDFSAIMPEDSVLPLTLTIGDADNSEQLSVTISGVPAGASLNAGTDNHDGSWTLQPSELTGLQLTPAANWNGEIQLGITVTSTDGTSHAETTSNLKISVTPVEDLSTVSGEDHLDVTEGTASPGADLIIQDPDTPAATFINVDHQQGDQGYGEFSMRDGHWTFEPGPKATALPDGAHATDTVTFRTTDGAEHQVVVNITGSDSPSHISGTLTYGMAEGNREFEARDTASGSLTIVDPDTGSVQPTLPDFTHQAGDNGYGYFTMQGGHWTFTPDLAAVVPLKDGEHVQDTFTVHASDGREAVITVSITGANSAPTVSGSVHLPNLGDESPVTITEAQLLSHASDIDLAASESLSVSGVTVDHGSITHHSVGTWIFTPETGYTGSVQFSYQVEDQHHGITHASADLTVLAPPPTLSAAVGNLGTVSGMRLQESSTTLLASADGTAQELNPVDMSVVLDGNGVGFIIQGGLDPNLITGLAIDGQPVTGTPTITTGPDYNSNVVVFQNLDPTAFANAHTVTFTVADGAPATLDVKVIVDEYGMGSFEMFPSEYRTYHIDRVEFHAATETAFQVQGAAEDSDIPLVISATPVDPSHQMSVVVGGLPAGASLSAGHDNGDGTWTLSSAELSDLKLTPPEDWSGTLHLSVVATETDGVNSTQAQTTMDIDVIPVADAPTLSVTPVVGDEDSAIQLDIDLGGHTDASETVTLSIVGVPDGASLSAGHKQPDGSWLVDAGDVSGLSLTPPQDFNGHIDLSVTATSREATGEFARSQTATLTVNVDATNDAPTATLQGISFDEDTTYHFSASDFGFTDIDSGDQLDHVTFTALPNAAQGTLMLNGQALTSGQNIAVSEIPNLAFQPAPDYYGGVTLAYTVSDGTADSEVTHGTLDVRGVRDVSVVSGVDQVDVAVGYFDFSHLDPTVHSGRNPNAFGDLHIQETMNSFIPIYSSRSDNGYGYFVVRDNGHWQFFLGDTHGDMSALDGIPKGETVTDTLTVMTSDGVKHTLTVSILNPTPEQLAALKAGSDEAQGDDTTSDFTFTADADAGADDTSATDGITTADDGIAHASVDTSHDSTGTDDIIAARSADHPAADASPLADYMQFAGGPAQSTEAPSASEPSAVDDYLAAAGVSPDQASPVDAVLPPTEELLEQSADQDPDDTSAQAQDDQGVADEGMDVPDYSENDHQQDDPQHHGI